MKFWQLVDIFRDEDDLLLEVFNLEQWRNYLENYYNLEQIVAKQNRQILDEKIDTELLKIICSKSNKKVYLSINKKKIYSYKSSFAEKEITILDAINLFSHNSIEEVFEKSESDISLSSHTDTDMQP